MLQVFKIDDSTKAILIKRVSKVIDFWVPHLLTMLHFSFVSCCLFIALFLLKMRHFEGQILSKI